MPSHNGPAPVTGENDPGALRDRYIVVFDKGTSAAAVASARDDARARGATIHYDYRHALTGFAATLPERALEALRNNQNVSYIETDRVVEASDTQSPATWGLDRIDQRNLPLSNSYTYNATGSGVTAYIIDTGIRFSHVEFGGRAVSGYDAIDGGSANDCNGHGTHVAGTAGGATYGVAKGVRLVAVRVLDCAGSGTNSGVIAGVDWVTSNHTAGQPAIANMSLGGSANSSLDTAVNNSINDGVSYAVAAGNSNADACNYSPARVTAAITVGSTTSSDSRSSFSNYGSCLDLFAPGSSITSAWYTSDTATNTISGTSMAAPHVAGVAALYLENDTSASPSTVRNAIVNAATSGVLSGIGSGSPNLLLYSLVTAPPATDECTLPESYSGTLSGTGDYDYHPKGTYYYSSVSGTHRGCLRGPTTGADFDLYLYKWNGSSWVIVARSESADSSEDIAYSGTAGYYLWEVYSYSGSGSYIFEMKRP
ncbi:MAG: S8 family peptidase [Actinomycetota bacterium]|nr:S8 family peptidase [Actinomycetota bacterium]